MKITLTKEERELMEPAVNSKRMAEHGLKEAVRHDKACSDGLFALLTTLFPNFRIMSFDHPTDGDWTVTGFDESDPRFADYDKNLDAKRLLDPMKRKKEHLDKLNDAIGDLKGRMDDLKPMKDGEEVEDDPELKLEPTIKEENLTNDK